MIAKSVVSVSLGSSSRDHEVVTELLGREFTIRRQGVDGDLVRARERIRELDGTVDAIGIGGIDVYLWAGERRYSLREGCALLRAAKQTPIADGSGLKHTLERYIVQWLLLEKRVPLAGKSVLIVSALDRFGLAESLAEVAGSMVYGDLIFALGVPVPIRSLATLHRLAWWITPVVAQAPIRWLYPVGKEQERLPSQKFGAYYHQADIIAGDFHLIRKYLPDELPGKTVITNTVTSVDVELLRSRGVTWLVTTTPNLGGRSLGTNVLEAAFLAILNKRWEAARPDEYYDLIRSMQLRPRVEQLNP